MANLITKDPAADGTFLLNGKPAGGGGDTLESLFEHLQTRPPNWPVAFGPAVRRAGAPSPSAAPALPAGTVTVELERAEPAGTSTGGFGLSVDAGPAGHIAAQCAGTSRDPSAGARSIGARRSCAN